MLTLDGSRGEGGGQILRTALALAAALGRPVSLTRIRAGRPKPGLQPQHLTAVRALTLVTRARVWGDALDSTELAFEPGELRGGPYRLDVGAIRGSAGAVSLVFQSLLLALALGPGPTRLTLVGGTHVPWSPPFHYLTAVFLPLLQALGVRARLRLVRWGYYPAGGGQVDAEIEPAGALSGWTPPAPGPPPRLSGLSAVSRLPRHIALRQRERAMSRLGEAGLAADVAIEEDTTSVSPGTFVFLAAPERAGFSALGRRGLPAEAVADQAADALLAWARSPTHVDERLADQVLPFLARARGPSAFTCPAITSHLRTVAWVVEQFLPCRIRLDDGPPARVEVDPAAA